MKRFSLLVLFFIGTVMTLHAATYCAETITSTNGKHTAKITCSSLGGNQYQFVFVSTEAFTSYNTGSNFFMNVNGVGGYQVSAHLKQTENTLTATIESNVVPNIYRNDFYVIYSDGEAHFIIPTDADFSQTCSTSEGGGTEPPFDPNTNLALYKPVVAGFGDNPAYITDGNLGTRWSGQGAPQDHSKDWVYIDLGDSYRLSEVDIFFENAYSKRFVIQGANELPADDVSNDLFWKQLYSFSGEPLHTGNTGDEAGKNAYMVSGVARYVRIRSYSNWQVNAYGMSIWEVRVYGTGKATPVVAEPKITTAEVVSFNAEDNSLTLRLIASTTIAGEKVYTRDFCIKDPAQGFAQRLITDENNLLTLHGLKACESYQFSIVAIDESYNMSKESSLSYALESAEWAYGKTCTAGYTQNDNAPNLAVDGDMDTRWSGYGAGNGECWWQVDMGEIHDVKEIRILFQNDWIDDYTISASNDGSNWAPIVIRNESPDISSYVRHSVSAIARYMRIEVFGERRNLSFYDFSVSGSCVIDEKPRMVLAQVVDGSITTSSAQIRVSAVDAKTSFDKMQYHIVKTQGNDVTTMENVSAPTGLIALTGLEETTEYTLEIWAIDEDGNRSDNSLKLTFTTLGQLVDLYLGGTMNGWNSAHPDYRFRKTAVSGVYALTTHLNAGAWIYKLTNGINWNTDNSTATDHHLVLSEPTDVTFYARSVSNFASSADSIFLLGTAIKDQEWTVPAHAQYCAWSGTQAIWSGEVDIAGEYKIIKIAYLTGPTPFAFKDDLCETNQSISGITTTQAIFTFDLPTLTWSWREVHDGQCDFMGNRGDGQTGNGSQRFTTGYNLSLWLNATKDAVVLTAEFLDTDKTATIAYMQNYPQRDETKEINEIQLDRVGDTQIFTKKIPFTSFTNKADGVIRFGVKFAFSGGLRVTTPEFFYLDGSGCAKRIFTIYHHDDMPADPEDGAVTRYAGGRILQPIRYKRMLRPDTWETLCLPFEVDSITVYDPDDGKNYKLYAQYRTDGLVYSGEFWLRTFEAVASEVTQADFQSNWQDIKADSREKALPKKGVPYIIRVPAGNYYLNKYLVFHGAGYQTIEKTYSAPALPADGYFSYSGNNTMRPWNLHTAYVLDAPGEYFWADQTVTLQPFECAVNATQTTINRMPRLQMASRQIATDHSLPSTADEQGRIYTLMGTLVGQYSSVDAKDAALQRLPEGLYILQTDRETSKIYIAK